MIEYLGYFALFIMNVWSIGWADVLQAMKSAVALRELSSLTSPDTNMLSKEPDSICSSLLIHSGLQALTAADTLHHSVFCRLYKQKSPKATAERCRIKVPWNGSYATILLLLCYMPILTQHKHRSHRSGQWRKKEGDFQRWNMNVSSFANHYL